jgi:acyl-CoA reductase-like NAD-dependent aldehyde dehydrogenase
VNIVSGMGNRVGEALASDREIDVISFTGSESVGRRLMELAARSPILKKLVLELGGKGPFIVEPDCDLSEAVDSTILGLCYNQGEVCCAMTRLILHSDIHDAFLEKLSDRMSSLRMGDVLDPQTQLGSLISAAHLQRVDGYVKEAVKEGARLVCGGERYVVPPCDKGSYYRPTVLDNVKKEARCWREEIFGPVLVAAEYRDIQDAIRMANDTSFGLGANLFTRNYRTAFWAARKINAGSVWVNIQNGSQIAWPFGGNKNSGMGREYGVFGLHEYLKVKNNVWNMGEGLRSRATTAV